MHKVTGDNFECAVILVVDGEELPRLISAAYLKEAGFRVLESADADNALKLLESRTDIRAVVLDAAIPGTIDGTALAQRIYQRWPRIGLLIVSRRKRPKTPTLPPDTAFLSKPYFGPSIVGHLRAIIDANPMKRK